MSEPLEQHEYPFFLYLCRLKDIGVHYILFAFFSYIILEYTLKYYVQLSHTIIYRVSLNIYMSV